MDQGGGGTWCPPRGDGIPSCHPPFPLAQGGLCTMEPRFLAEAEIPNGVDIGQLITNFGTTANAIAAMVSIEQVIEDTLHQG